MSLQKAKDEFLLKKVLFDAVLSVEYSFIYENAKNIKSLALTRLILTHVAVEHLRYEELVIVWCILFIHTYSYLFNI